MHAGHRRGETHPSVELPGEGLVLAVDEVLRDHLQYEPVLVVDLPRPSVRLCAESALESFVRENGGVREATRAEHRMQKGSQNKEAPG